MSSSTSTSTDAESEAVLGMLAYALLTVAVTLVAVVWKSASIAMLTGLTYYILPETAEERRRAQLAQAQAKASGSTRRRKAAAANNNSSSNNKSSLDDELANEDSIAAVRVQKSMLARGRVGGGRPLHFTFHFTMDHTTPPRVGW